MAVIKYKKGDRVTMKVTRADNILIAYVSEATTNRRKLYERDTDYCPLFHDEVDIGPGLRGSKNAMLLTGINFTGGGRFEVRIEVNSNDVFDISEDLGENSSKSWHLTFERE